MSVSSNASSASSSVTGVPISNGSGNRPSLGRPGSCDSSSAGSDSSELTHILNRRQVIMDSQEAGIEVPHQFKVVNVYTEFHEFSRKQIKDYQKTFNKYDVGHDGYLDLTELKFMMEKLGAPQTHLGLKQMIAEVDEDHDGKISFREFLLIYRKAQAGELDTDSGLNQLARLTEINVEEVGVTGAKNFFEAKIEQQLRSNKFHDEIRQEQEERRREEEERANRRLQFQQRAAIFQ
ncbi:EF-hand domain-containing protein D2 homolog [Zeugodacus cucurbitae]|uniref:EF-hand domain-containing protein CG10641 n=1 Tax=Zeugodacus cucurbitae TaxID=28588 RepID=A0A0A1XBE7_ZEUCU|nr:EF-hand domain-containing protein D2 homolog [Zeugodacus cucurbitae]XP_054082738.1 EF-hand domain-containing protein D2 homolog [Zeugodacus cucurbitae]